MPVPPEPIVRAARRWIELLPTTEPNRLRTLFATYPEFSDLTSTQYETAYSLLESFGVLPLRDNLQHNLRKFLEGILRASNPLWLKDADDLIRNPGEVPQDASSIAAALGLSDIDTFASVKSVSGKVNLAEREALGAAGENELVALLRKSLDGEVEQVSLDSDGFGYDIRVTCPELIARLEVKSTTKINQPRVFISRHEYDVMQADEHWHMILVQLSADLRLVRLSTVSRLWIELSAPVDVTSVGRWESASLRLPKEALIPGVPGLHSVMRGRPELLVGAPSGT